MPKQPIPAKGFTECHGRRPSGFARLSPETKVYAQIRGGSGTRGWVDPVPWKLERIRWDHDGSAGDLIGVRLVE